MVRFFQPLILLGASLLLPTLSLSPLARAAELLPAGTVAERLDNGLSVIVVPLPGAGLVALQTWVSVGSRDEVVAGSTGYAHFFEHLMFRGSANYTAEERERALLRLGAVDNAWTSDDHTCYHMLARAEHLPALLRLEADRFSALALTPDAVRRESGAVMGEFRKDRSDPTAVLYEHLYATAFTAHTYRHTPIGLEEDVLAMADGYEKARRFYAQHYRPENLTVVIAGEVDPDAALAAAREAWGGWAPEPVADHALPIEGIQTAERRVTVDWPDPGAAPQLAIGWRAPAFDPASSEVAAWHLLSAMLTADAAPLRRRLLEDDQLAWSLWSEPPERLDPSLLTLYVRLREGVDPAAVEAAIAEEIAALQGASDERVAAARERARRSMLLSLDDPQSWAFQVGWYAALGGGDPAALELHLDAVEGVTTAHVRAAARQLSADRRTVITLVPAAAGEE